MMESIYWFIGGIIFILLEIVVPGMIIIFFGLSALLIGILTYAGILSSLSLQFFLWAFFSLVLILLLRKALTRMFPSLETHAFSSDSLEGQVGIVVEEIDPVKGKGRVKVGGSYWKAISYDGTIIPVEKEVIVVKQDGLLLYVKNK